MTFSPRKDILNLCETCIPLALFAPKARETQMPMT